MLKPEDIGIFPVGTKDLKGTVQSRKYAGERVYYNIEVGGIELKTVSQSSFLYNIGDQVSLEVNISDPIIFEE